MATNRLLSETATYNYYSTSASPCGAIDEHEQVALTGNGQSRSASARKTMSNLIQMPRVYDEQDTEYESSINSSVGFIEKQIGIALWKLSPYNSIISRVYAIFLWNSALFSLLLIICNFTNNSFWNSSVVRSDSQIYMVFAYVCLMSSYGLSNILLLRICLGAACVFFMLWGLYGIPGVIVFDCIIWNLFMLLNNIQSGFFLVYARRYIPFEAEFEQLYVNKFKAYLSRSDFSELVKIGDVRRIQANECLRRKGSEVFQLAFLSKGRAEIVPDNINLEAYKEKRHRVSPTVIQERHRRSRCRNASVGHLDAADFTSLLVNKGVITVIKENEFIDDTEWIEANLEPDHESLYETAVIATTDCVYVEFERQSLTHLLSTSPVIRQAVLNALGIDTAVHLIRARRFAKASLGLRESEAIDYHQNDGQ